MKDWEFEAYICPLKEQNLDNAAHHFSTSNTIPWATQDDDDLEGNRRCGTFEGAGEGGGTGLSMV